MDEHTQGVNAFRVHPEPWIAFQPALDAMLAPLGQAVTEALALAKGQAVLDVGCGCGTTTLQLASVVGATGSATGIDTSTNMIAVARGAAARAGRANVEFIEGDAATAPFPPHGYDAVFSRLGTMFFEHPEAAFANLRRGMVRSGQLGFVCWRALEENQWASEPRRAAAEIVPLPASGEMEPSGPFALARPERISSILSGAGFVDVEIAPLDVDLLIGRGDIDEAVEFYLRLLPTGYLMFEPDRHLLDRLHAALSTVLERHRGEGGIRLGSAAWVVTAR